MFIRDLIRYNLYYPENDGNNTAGPLTSTSIEDELNSDVDDKADDVDGNKADDVKLKLDEDDKETDDKVDDDDEDDDADDESDSDEDSDEDEDDDDKEKAIDLEAEDELELARIPKRQEIKAAYPDIFKKFPALDHIIQREHAFAEVFPTVSDARNAKTEVGNFKQFQDELLSGDIAGVLKSVKSANPNAFTKITDGLLDTLMKVDSNSHLGITARVTKGILNHVHQTASQQLKRDPNNKQAQQLQIASELLHESIFNTSEVTPFNEQKQTETENPEAVKLKKDRADFDNVRFQAAFNTVANSVSGTLTKAVERDIDIKNLLPPYVKTRVVKEVMGELDRQLMTDTRFKNVIDKLWQRARENNFNDENLNHIKSALKEKAKTILQPIMRAKKGEALKGLGVRNKSSEERSSSNGEARTSGDKKPSQKKSMTRSRSEGERLVPKDGESIADFLARE